MKNSKKWLSLSVTLVLSLLLVLVSVPVFAAPDAPQAGSLSKMVEPEGMVDFGDMLTYTVHITPSASTIYMPFYFRDDLQPGLVWEGFVGEHTGFGWDPAAHAITSTQLTTQTEAMTLTFKVSVLPQGSSGVLVSVSNVAGLCLQPDQTVNMCVEVSNEVQNQTKIPYQLFLPLIMRDFTPS